jgi:hypothetical protein
MVITQHWFSRLVKNFICDGSGLGKTPAVDKARYNVACVGWLEFQRLGMTRILFDGFDWHGVKYYIIQ